MAVGFSVPSSGRHGEAQRPREVSVLLCGGPQSGIETSHVEGDGNGLQTPGGPGTMGRKKPG